MCPPNTLKCFREDLQFMIMFALSFMIVKAMGEENSQNVGSTLFKHSWRKILLRKGRVFVEESLVR